MTIREVIGYVLLIAFLTVLGWIWWRWRQQVIGDRIRRWGTPLPPHKARRRGRS